MKPHQSSKTAKSYTSPAIKYHDETVAEKWNSRYEQLGFRRRIQTVENFLGNRLLNGQVWLDAGCGTGIMARLLHKKGASVTAVDASPNMLSQATRLSKEHYPNVHFQQINTVEDLPFEETHFDGIACSSVLEYVDSPKQCLEDFHRVLKVGGLLVLSVPSGDSVLRWAHTIRYRLFRVIGGSRSEFIGLTKNTYSRRSIEELLVVTGFELKSVELVGGLLPLVGPCESRFISPLIFTMSCKT